jgi:cyclopropane fatty-acyl-phospholipid synthase-like methyltransferase
MISFFRKRKHSEPNNAHVFVNTPEYVASYYDEWTPSYMDGFGEIFQSNQCDDIDEFFNYYIKSIGLKDGDKVIDAGCGVGGPAINIAKRKKVFVDALTISQEQVAIARQKISDAKLEDQIKVHQLDFHKMAAALPPESYDAIYFMESLVHSTAPKKVLEQCYTLLKREGVLYIKDLFAKTAFHPDEQKNIDKWVDHNNKAMFLNIIPKEEVLMMARELGYVLQFCKLIELPTNQDLGNAWSIKNNVMPDPSTWQPYLEWYEIKFYKPYYVHI